MKKSIKLTLSEDILVFLNSNFINKSAYVEALIRQKMHTNTVSESVNKQEENKEKEEDINSLFDKDIA